MSAIEQRRLGTVRILGISGSLRTASFNTKLLRAAAGLVGEGVRLELWHQLAAVPPFNEDDESQPSEPVRAMRRAISDADALLIATPESHGTARQAGAGVGSPPRRGRSLCVTTGGARHPLTAQRSATGDLPDGSRVPMQRFSHTQTEFGCNRRAVAGVTSR